MYLHALHTNMVCTAMYVLLVVIMTMYWMRKTYFESPQLFLLAIHNVSILYYAQAGIYSVLYIQCTL